MYASSHAFSCQSIWCVSGQMSVCLTFLPFSLSAKQKLEDRLSAAAREKLAQASKESKERQLQAERKRKAALFLQTLRGPEAEVKRTKETAAAHEVCLCVCARFPALSVYHHIHLGFLCIPSRNWIWNTIRYVLYTLSAILTLNFDV